MIDTFVLAGAIVVSAAFISCAWVEVTKIKQSPTHKIQVGDKSVEANSVEEAIATWEKLESAD